MNDNATVAMLALGIDATDAEVGARKFSKATDTVVQKAHETAKGLTVLERMFQNVFAFEVSNAVIDGFKKIGLAVLGSIRDATTLASRYNELGVVLSVVGPRAGLTARELAVLEAGLRKTGISAIQTRQSILSMIQANLDLANASKLARVAQDVAVVGQISSSEALQRLTHGIVSGQTEVLRTMGVMVNFESEYKKFARTIDTTTSALTEQQKVQVRMDATMRASAQLTGAYEASMTNAGKQMRSIETRYIPDLKVALGQVFDASYTSLVFQYADALKSAAEWTQANTDKLTAWGAVLATIPDGIGRLTKRFDEAGRYIEGVTEYLDAIGESDGAARQEKAIGKMNRALEASAALSREARLENERTLATFRGIDLSPLKVDTTGTFAPAGAQPFSQSTGSGLFRNPFPRASTDLRASQGEVAKYEADQAAKAEQNAIAAAAGAKAARDAFRDATRSAADFLRALGETTPLQAFERSIESMLERMREAKVETKGFRDAALDAFRLKDVRENLVAAANAVGTHNASLNEMVRVSIANRAESDARAKAIRDVVRATEQQIGAEELAIEANRRGGKERALILDQMAKAATFKRLLAQGVSSGEAMSLANRQPFTPPVEATETWVSHLRDAAQLVQGIASSFTNLPDLVRQTISGMSQIAGGIGALGGRDSKGNAVNSMASLTGKNGVGTQLQALGGYAAIIGGVVQLADALDLFGRKARENAKIMAEANAQVTASLTAFEQETRSLGGASAQLASARASLAQSIPGAITAAYGPGATMSTGANALSYVSQSQLDFQRGEQQRLAAAAAEAGGSRTLAGRGFQAAADSAGKLGDTIARMLDGLKERALALVPQVLGSIDRQYNSMQGNEDANARIAAAEQWQQNLNDLQALFAAGVLPLERYNAEVARTGDIFYGTIEKIEAAAKKAADDTAFGITQGNRALDARIMAGNDPLGAQALRQAAEYEAELREARERGLDITKVLAAQEVDTALRARDAANARRDRDLGYTARESALGGNQVQNTIDAARQRGTQEMNAALQDATMSVQDIARLGKLIGEEFTAVIVGLRESADNLLGSLAMGAESNPVVRAQMEATRNNAAAQRELTDYLNAGIITLEEFTQGMKDATASTALSVAAAQQQQRTTRTGFIADLLGTIAGNNPNDRNAARASFLAQGDVEKDGALASAYALQRAGTITKNELDLFVSAITDKFSPAVRDAAWQLNESTRIMQSNVSSLQQQWGVFDANTAQRLKDTGDLYGFTGLSIADVQQKYTKTTLGSELTPQQLAENAKIADYINAYRANEDAMRQQREQQMAQQSPGVSASAPAERFRVLDEEVTSVRSARSVSEVTAMAANDIGLSQLAVQREILATIKANMAAKATGSSASSADRDFGFQATVTALLVNGKVA